MTVKRTSILIDTQLIARAATALGTGRTTDTIRAALEEAVRRSHVENLVGWQLPDDAPDRLERQRRARP